MPNCNFFFSPDVSTPSGNCNEGEVRLMGGVNITQGRLEICVNDAWGTVCSNRFGTNEAVVVCRQLQFSESSESGSCIYINNDSLSKLCVGVISIIGSDLSEFGQSPSPIFLDNLACTGSESNLSSCHRSVIGLHQCDHSQDVGLQCFGMSPYHF